MNFGLSESDFELLKKLVIKPLQNNSVCVYIFGSRATGKNHPFSDVDLLLEPLKPGTPSSALLSEIKEAIEESRFPVKVELVLLDQLAQSYRERVLLEKKKIS